MDAVRPLSLFGLLLRSPRWLVAGLRVVGVLIFVGSASCGALPRPTSEIGLGRFDDDSALLAGSRVPTGGMPGGGAAALLAERPPLPSSDPRHRPVADYEASERVLIAWPTADDDVDAFLVEVIAAAGQRLPVTVMVESRLRRDTVTKLLRLADLDPAGIDLDIVPLNTVWIRDYGPIFVRAEDGEAELVDFPYAADRPDDDAIPGHLADRFDLRVRPSHLAMEGGHFASDSRGRCVITDDVLLRNLDRGLGADEVKAALRLELGCRSTTIVPALEGEGTGHLDVFLLLTGPGRALVGRYDPREDAENALLLDRSAALLETDGWLVERIPMPSNDSRELFRTHTNVLPLPRAVLVPVFHEDRRFEAEALRVIGRAYPGREVLPITADGIIGLEGSVHCTTIAIPRTGTSPRLPRARSAARRSRG